MNRWETWKGLLGHPNGNCGPTRGGLSFIPSCWRRELFALLACVLVGNGKAATLWSIGDPTPEEQLYLELMNRARATPSAEGQRLRDTTDPDVVGAYNYFGVDRNLMYLQFQALAPAPPLSMNPKLLAAARSHSQDMSARQYQDHTGSDGSTPGSRATAQGYSWQTLAENVSAYSKQVFFGHASFEVDWGYGLGGMQTPPGHRVNAHNPVYREVGVGVVDITGKTVGPQLVTEDLATTFSSMPFITGVIYSDRNGNQFYDIGEGITGVTVTVSGSAWYAVSASAGGYSVPVPGDGIYTVTFSGGGVATRQQTVTVAGSQNAKLDYLPSAAGSSGVVIRILALHLDFPLTDIDFRVEAGNPVSFTLQSAPSPAGPWSDNLSALILPEGSNQYRASTTPALSSMAFYRIVAF